MRLDELCTTETRIVEIHPVDGALGHALMVAGRTRYLAVAASEHHRDAIVTERPGLSNHLTVSRSSQAVSQNNAEILILNGRSCLHIARFRSVRHATYVAVTLKSSPLAWLAVLFGFFQCILGRFAWPRFVSCNMAGGPRRLIAFRVRRPRSNYGARRFIPHTMGVEKFLRLVNSSGARHAVLRWFETLPQEAAGDDLALLVDDADLPQIRALLDMGPGVQPLDLYSVTGLPGADYGKMTYYPPFMAEELLERAIDHRGLCKVPAPREHFLSLAYHALYHKGLSSGLQRRGENSPQRVCPDRDYTAILGNLAQRLNIDVPITLEDLDDYLDSQGWRPPHDTLVRLTRNNAWARTLITRPSTGRNDNGLAVFLIREQAVHRGGIDMAAEWLARKGFHILSVERFDVELSDRVARSTRGGNWGQGPWCNSGGKPVAAIVVHDPAPIRPNRQRRRRQPHVANARLFCKEDLREVYNRGFPKDQHCNVVHSSDNGHEALDYLRIIMPDQIEEVLARISPLQVARAA